MQSTTDCQEILSPNLRISAKCQSVTAYQWSLAQACLSFSTSSSFSPASWKGNTTVWARIRARIFETSLRCTNFAQRLNWHLLHPLPEFFAFLDGGSWIASSKNMTRTYLKTKLQRRKCGQTERFAHKAQQKLCSHSTQLIEDSAFSNAFSNAESAACNSRIIEDARQCAVHDFLGRLARLCTAPQQAQPWMFNPWAHVWRSEGCWKKNT